MSKQTSNQMVWLPVDLINSKAFNSLTGYAPQLLLHVLRKRKFERHSAKSKRSKKSYVCINSDSLNITYTEFWNSFRITKPRMTKAIGQLLARGFISVIYQGGGCRKDKSIFALSDTWRLWHKGVVFEVRENEKVKRGFCKPRREQKVT